GGNLGIEILCREIRLPESFKNRSYERGGLLSWFLAIRFTFTKITTSRTIQVARQARRNYIFGVRRMRFAAHSFELFQPTTQPTRFDVLYDLRGVWQSPHVF